MTVTGTMTMVEGSSVPPSCRTRAHTVRGIIRKFRDCCARVMIASGCSFVCLFVVIEVRLKFRLVRCYIRRRR